MTKHARAERDRREAENVRIKEIEAAWMGSLTPAVAKAFTDAVARVRARPPQEPPAPDGARHPAASAPPGPRAAPEQGGASAVLARLQGLTAAGGAPASAQISAPDS